MPNNATSNGSCLYKDENHQAITIRWAADDGNLEDFNSITITFERNQSKYTIKLNFLASHVFLWC